jgi:hypothetical protein
MEPRQLHYIVAVAEELHFARAASRVQIAQPALSTQIQSQKRELGVKLRVRTKAVAWTAPVVCQSAQSAFDLRPDRSATGGGNFGSISAKRSETSTLSTAANASRAPTVTFSVPRSTRPTYERSISASRPRRSCERPFTTRSLLRFQPILCRTSMPPERHIRCLTIDGL